ncbi:hypothetical protein HCH52_10895 [Oscillospiraceae bacterium HV4-5-C5C]|nr:hypothetical protein [Oscillospiraceae bacterium HV4-5-C5C]
MRFNLKAGSAVYRTLYEPRLHTDRLFIPLPALAQLKGRLDQAIRQIEDCQLKDRDLWPLFVRQFSLHSDDLDQGWRGEYWGKLMRGACFTLAYTKDTELAAIMGASVRELLACQDEAGRIATYSQRQEFQGWDIWNRKYVMLGLLYYYPLCQDRSLQQEIELSLRRQADYLLAHIGPAEQQLLPITATSDYWQGMNASSILEPFVLLYNLTHEARYLDFATYIVNSGAIASGDLFKLALEGKQYPYQYPVTKAYEMMSCFEGLLEYYRVTGTPSCRQAVENFARLVLTSDITVIGCAGCTHELFDHSAFTQTDPELNRRTHMQETCVTVTWMKLCLQLLTLTGQTVWGDALEQSIYNALLGAMNDQHETCSVDRSLQGYHLEAAGLRADSMLLPFDSYSPLLANLRGQYVGGLKALQDGRFYGCCAAIGSAGTGLIPQAAVLLNDDGLSVNLYIAGQIKLDFADGCSWQLAVQTDYPLSGFIRIVMLAVPPQPLTLALRIPEWSRENQLLLNNQAQAVKPGSFARLQRVWQAGDTLTLQLDMRIQARQQNGYLAFRRGPVQLAADARIQDPDQPVSVELDGQGYVMNSTLIDDIPFPHGLGVDMAQTDGSRLRLIDYASAGKTWQADSRTAAWLPQNSR